MIYLDEADLDYIPSTKGEDVRKFEKAMAQYLGVDDCVAVNSGTSALHLALLACGIGRKDTVVVPATTFVATANAVLYTGAKVKIVDINPETWLIEDGNYKNVIPVILYGTRARCRLNVNKSNTIIIDAAQKIDFYVQSDIEYACFSFNGNKTITAGGGGLVAGKNLTKIRKLIRPAHSNGLAYNCGMSAHNARLVLEQLKNVESYLEKKQKFNEIYREELPFLTFQKAEPSPYWMTAALFPEFVKIEHLKLKLQCHGIPSRRIFKPLNHYKHLSDGKTHPNAEYIYKHGLCLPSSTKNSIEDISTVCKTIKKLI